MGHDVAASGPLSARASSAQLPYIWPAALEPMNLHDGGNGYKLWVSAVLHTQQLWLYSSEIAQRPRLAYLTFLAMPP